jgi:hypothetical protein
MNTYTLDDEKSQPEREDEDCADDLGITPEQQRILDSLIDPDEPEDPKTLPLPVSEEFKRLIVGALLCDAEFLREASSHLRANLFEDQGLGFLATAAKLWAGEYGSTPPPRFFIEDQIRIKKAHPVILDQYDALVSAAQPEHVKYCRACLVEFVKTQEVRRAIGKFLDGKDKAGEDLDLFLADLGAARSIGSAENAFMDMADLLASSTGYDWLIEDILYAGSLSVVSGAAGAGKTCFLLQVLMDWLHGAPVFGGKESHPGTVCWLDYDANGEHLRDNLRVALGGRDAVPVRERFMYATCGGDNSLPQVLTTTYLDGVVRRHRPKIVVIDPLRAAFAATPKMPSGWENDSGTMTTLLAPFRQWAHHNNVAVVFVHHFNRQGTISGSAAIQACSDVLWNFDRPENGTAAALRISKRLPKTHISTWEYIDRRYLMNHGDPTQPLAENVYATRFKLAEQIWAALPASQRSLDDIGKQNKLRDFARTVVAELSQAGAIARPSDKKPWDKADEAKYQERLVTWQAEAAKC